jgi:protein O-GlcNAc transferase
MQEKLDDAIASYREAIRLKPDYAEAHFNLGSALAQQGNLEEAEDAFEEARRLKPGINDEP